MSRQTPSNVVRVLLVEDDPGDAGRMRALLQEARTPSFTVAVAPTAQDALDELGVRPYDAVLLALSRAAVQSGEGFDAIRHLDKTAPVVVLGALDDEEIAFKAVKRGAQDYLVKDRLIPELLVRSLRYAQERHRLLAEQNRRLEYELKIAAFVQQSFLPGVLPATPGPRHRRLPARQRPGRRRLLRPDRAAARSRGPGGGRRVRQGNPRGDSHGRDPGHPARGSRGVRDADRARPNAQPRAAAREEPGPVRHPLLRRADPPHRAVQLRQRRASAGAAAGRRRRVGPRLDRAPAPALSGTHLGGADDYPRRRGAARHLQRRRDRGAEHGRPVLPMWKGSGR